MRATPDIIVPFGGGHTASIFPDGSINIRIVDDTNNATLVGGLRIHEFARVAKEVFSRVANDCANKEIERNNADTVVEIIENMEQVWRNRYPCLM